MMLNSESIFYKVLDDFIKRELVTSERQTALVKSISEEITRANPYLIHDWYGWWKKGDSERESLRIEIYNFLYIKELRDKIAKRGSLLINIKINNLSEISLLKQLLQDLDSKLKEEDNHFKILQENEKLKTNIIALEKRITKKNKNLSIKITASKKKKKRIKKLKRDLTDIKEGTKKWIKIGQKYILTNNKKLSQRHKNGGKVN